MNTVNIPGFTAERSIDTPHGQFYTAAFDFSYAADAEVRPQKIICHRENGVLVCVDPACREHCYQTKKGSALLMCLDNC